MDHARCNIFEDVRDTDCSNVVHSLQILEAIQDGRWDDQIVKLRSEADPKKKSDLKILLPCVTFSGVFKRRRVEGIHEYSSIVVIDVDKIRREEIPAVKDRLRNDDHVAAFFESPTKGLKILFHVDSGVEDHKEYAFPALSKYMMDYHRIEADPSGKDISRLCFISSDPDLYYNDSYTIFPVGEYKADQIAKQSAVRTFNAENMDICYDLNYIFETCIKMVQKSAIGAYSKGNRNNYIFSLSCALNRAGVAQMDSVDMILSKYSSLGTEEIEAAVDSAYRNQRTEFATKLITVRKSSQGGLFD